MSDIDHIIETALGVCNRLGRFGFFGYGSFHISLFLGLLNYLFKDLYRL